ncbi:MAG TPA: hypothetical protein VGL49_01260 [Acidimicrobiales bacterium]
MAVTEAERLVGAADRWRRWRAWSALTVLAAGILVTLAEWAGLLVWLYRTVAS